MKVIEEKVRPVVAKRQITKKTHIVRKRTEQTLKRYRRQQASEAAARSKDDPGPSTSRD